MAFTRRQRDKHRAYIKRQERAITEKSKYKTFDLTDATGYLKNGYTLQEYDRDRNFLNELYRIARYNGITRG